MQNHILILKVMRQAISLLLLFGMLHEPLYADIPWLGQMDLVGVPLGVASSPQAVDFKSQVLICSMLFARHVLTHSRFGWGPLMKKRDEKIQKVDGISLLRNKTLLAEEAALLVDRLFPELFRNGYGRKRAAFIKRAVRSVQVRSTLFEKIYSYKILLLPGPFIILAPLMPAPLAIEMIAWLVGALLFALIKFDRRTDLSDFAAMTTSAKRIVFFKESIRDFNELNIRGILVHEWVHLFEQNGWLPADVIATSAQMLRLFELINENITLDHWGEGPLENPLYEIEAYQEGYDAMAQFLDEGIQNERLARPFRGSRFIEDYVTSAFFGGSAAAVMDGLPPIKGNASGGLPWRLLREINRGTSATDVMRPFAKEPKRLLRIKQSNSNELLRAA